MALNVLIADDPEGWKPRTAEQADADWSTQVQAGILRRGSALCGFCEGYGRRERYVASMRRRAIVPCRECDGTGTR